jgi:predicted PurR-regulated permease PerM
MFRNIQNNEPGEIPAEGDGGDCDCNKPRIKIWPGHWPLVGLFVLSVLYTLYFARIFLMPLAFALVLSVLMHPLVRQLNRLKLPDTIGAGVVVLLLVLGLGTGVYYLSGPAAKWVDRGPYLIHNVKFKLSEFKSSLDKARQATRELEDMTDLGKNPKEVKVKESSLAEKIFSQVQSLSSSAVIILVLFYFLLAHGWRILEKVSAFDFPYASSGKGYRLILQIQADLSSYLLTVAFINFCLGLLTALVMALLNLPNPILWGAVAGTLNFIPYMGAAVTLIIISVVSLLTFDAWSQIAWPPLAFLFLTLLEGQFITPSLLGRRLTLNPLMVLLSILFWGWIWGIGGAVLGVPLLTAFMVAAKNIKSLQPIEKILA